MAEKKSSFHAAAGEKDVWFTRLRKSWQSYISCEELEVTVQVVPAPAGAREPAAPAQPLFLPVLAASPPKRAETRRLPEGQRPS